MKVLGVIGSPRKEGNTASLVERALEGARSVGAETEVVYMGEMDINPCLGCDDCKKTGQCTQMDDMQGVYEAIERARGLVLGSPVYFDQVSAQTKVFIDRLYCYVRTVFSGVNFPPDYKGVVAITYEAQHPTRYDYILEWMKKRLEGYHRIDVIDSLTAHHTVNQPVAERTDLLEKAYQAGRLLGDHVKELSS